MTIVIHDDPGYRLTAKIGGTPPTLELFACHPTAQHPREQRILCLTLPAQSLQNLASAAIEAAARVG